MCYRHGNFASIRVKVWNHCTGMLMHSIFDSRSSSGPLDDRSDELGPSLRQRLFSTAILLFPPIHTSAVAFWLGFSHNPADGSFAPLAFQPSANINSSSRTEFNYYCSIALPARSTPSQTPSLWFYQLIKGPWSQRQGPVISPYTYNQSWLRWCGTYLR